MASMDNNYLSIFYKYKYKLIVLINITVSIFNMKFDPERQHVKLLYR